MFKKELSVQEFFSIAYLYLLALGILSDALFYGILGVSYLSFTTVLDALISPVSMLTNNYLVSLVLIVAFVLMYLHIVKFTPYMYRKFKEKKWYRKMTNLEKAEKRMKALEKKDNIFKAMAFFFFLLFVSVRLGMGLGTKMKIQKLEHTPNYTITFTDNTSIDVARIGQNSIYIFYVKEGEQVVTATPIMDNVREIKRIKKLGE